MAVDKLIDSAKLDACLQAEANAIRAKTGGLSNIAFDFANNKGFADAISNISGGGSSGSSGLQVEVLEGMRSSTTTLTFSNLKGTPIAFNFYCDDPVATSSTSTVLAVVYDGTSLHGQTINTQIAYDGSSFSYTYNNGTLTITSTGPIFASTIYVLTYIYDGSSSNIDIKNVQVGSGATSITFSGLSSEPIAWSCIFKSNFPTSSGYQRVVYVEYSNDIIAGIEMDSGAKNANHWTATYSNGSLTIASNSQTQGGYFHQPGNYQLTAIYGDSTASSKNIQVYSGYATTNQTSYTTTAVTLTVAKTGTYKVSWMGFRSANSGTNGSQLYINDSAYGSANTTFVNTYGHSVTLTNVSLTEGQTLVVRARSGGTQYYMGVGNLIIEEQ